MSTPTELSSSQYATRRKELLALLKQLRATGLASTLDPSYTWVQYLISAQGELDLPRITVIGNQSAGKSSVVEAISGITVPRDAGTCTRCPMECRLSSSQSAWSCQISIRREYDSSGKTLDKVLEIPFGGVITDKKKVELALRRAQTAILNPHLSPAEILPQTAGKLTKQPFTSKQSLQFSRDTICIDLEGPDLTDLSFIDLPGLIQNADPNVIQLVEDMVISHIKGNCLILVALPMTDDIENQKALRLARQEDPEGHRTIGVMTKPDMLTSGSTKARDLWLDVVEGRRHPLIHGYYCTRQPDDAERAAEITPAQARASEALFFSKTQPWCSSAYRERFGTEHLISTLSKLLVGIINDALPRIRSETTRNLEACNRELATIPEKIDSEPATYMLQLLTAFCSDVQRQIDGGLEDGQLVHQNRASYAMLKRNIRRTAPNFIPFLKTTPDSGDADAGTVHNDNGKEFSSADTLSEGTPYFLNDMRSHIQQCIARELPNNVPFRAKELLITAFQAGWDSAIQVCFDAVYQSACDALEKRIIERFHRHEHLEGHIKVFVSEMVRKKHHTCSTHLRVVLQLEATPFTQNSHYLSESCAKWLGTYRGVRSGKGEGCEPAMKRRKLTDTTEVSMPTTPSPKVPASHKKDVSLGKRPLSAENLNSGEQDRETKINNILASLAGLGYTGLKWEDFGKLNPIDEYDTELQVMSEVRGYFQISYKRIIDNVPSLIDLMFLKPIGMEMQSFLIDKLSLGAPDAKDRCALYLAENPAVIAKRKEFLSRKDRLEEVQKALHNFGLS